MYPLGILPFAPSASAALPPLVFVSPPHASRPPHAPSAPIPPTPHASFLPLIASPPPPPVTSAQLPPPPVSVAQPPKQQITLSLFVTPPGRLPFGLETFAQTEFQILGTT